MFINFYNIFNNVISEQSKESPNPKNNWTLEDYLFYFPELDE